MTKLVIACASVVTLALLSASAQAQQTRNARPASDYVASPYLYAPHMRGELPTTWYEKAMADRDRNTF